MGEDGIDYPVAEGSPEYFPFDGFLADKHDGARGAVSPVLQFFQQSLTFPFGIDLETDGVNGVTLVFHAQPEAFVDFRIADAGLLHVSFFSIAPCSAFFFC